MYSRILLCYDGSREGRLALREGARLAQVTGGAVCLLAVVELTGAAGLGQIADATAIERQDSDVRAVLEEGRSRLTGMGLAPEVRIEQGDPVGAITRVARDWAADLVVVGHHRQGRLARWVTRSVASELSDRLDCSLLLSQKVVEDAELFAHA